MLKNVQYETECHYEEFIKTQSIELILNFLERINNYIFIFSALQMAYASSNPWDVPQIDSFNFLCCPECVYRSKEESTFQVKIYTNKVQIF